MPAAPGCDPGLPSDLSHVSVAGMRDPGQTLSPLWEQAEMAVLPSVAWWEDSRFLGKIEGPFPARTFDEQIPMA